ncbi:MAG: protein translocase subunit SecD [Myxococcota bacterium]|nr:protein translocase subunit SecD [Myxococcota bacterium]
MSQLRLRIASVAALLLVLGWLAVANFVPEDTRAESPLFPEQGMRLGLDLQGGIHWVLGVRLEVAEKHELDFIANDLERLAEDEGFELTDISVEPPGMTVTAVAASDLAEVRRYAQDHDGLEIVSEQGSTLGLSLTRNWSQDVRERGMAQVLEVLRRRIDDPVTGIPESVVTRQGDDRILVQIPGGDAERERARTLLKTTGHLEFKIVQDTAQTVELLQAKHAGGLPDKTEVVTEHEKETERVIGAYLVPDKASITGDYLTDARVQFDRQGRPIVGFTFNTEGGRIFGELTRDNIGEQLAVILDERVYSAPSIRSQINMRGQIEGRFTPQEAADLAVVLRAGSLAVPVEIEEERTVGPALGADSVRRGVQASMVGLGLILLFAIAYYRVSGLYAGVALFANLLLLIGIMSLFEATLTLPGLAGVVLTVGMAVDANVIIFERVREELRTGKTPRAAVATGFQKALWTILDANITTLITAIVLFQYGTGPIKGFAVTLAIGIVTSVFAAMVITRLLFEIYPGSRQVESLSI